MAIARALIGTHGAAGGNTVSTGSGTSTGGSGNHGLLFLSFDAGVSVSSISDSKSNSYTLLGSAVTSGSGAQLAVYYSLNWTGGASHTATANFSGTAFPVAHLVEVTGAASASPFDIDLGSGTESHPFSVASGALSQAAECVFFFAEQNRSGSSAEAYTSSSSTMISSEPDLASYWGSGLAASITASTGTANYQMQKGVTVHANNAYRLISVKEDTGGTRRFILVRP